MPNLRGISPGIRRNDRAQEELQLCFIISTLKEVLIIIIMFIKYPTIYKRISFPGFALFFSPAATARGTNRSSTGAIKCWEVQGEHKRCGKLISNGS